jgi:hypothetical protein
MIEDERKSKKKPYGFVVAVDRLCPGGAKPRAVRCMPSR